MSHLIIDTDRCIGCGRCVKVCIRANISVMDGKAKETPSGPMGCFDCGHCMAVCPKDAIRLEKYMDQNDRIVDHDDSKVIGYDTMMEFLRRRRSIRWFKDEKVPDDVLQKLFDASYYSPSAQNSQKVEFVVMDQRLDEFQSHIAKILEPLRDEYPRIGQFVDYVDDHSRFEYNPFLWEGKQVIIAFSEEPADAYIAMSRVELSAYSLGLGGFYSLWMSMADREDHERLMEFFPEIPKTMHMNALFVIGHPNVKYRRSLPHTKVKVHHY